MRIIFHNPHSSLVIGKTLLDFILRIHSYKKYSYLLDYIRQSRNDFAFYIDNHDSSLPSIAARIIPAKVEVYLWMIVNKINPLKVKLVWNIDELKKDDIFFSFSLKNLDTNYSGTDNIFNKKFLKIFHITHFVQNTSLIAENAKRLQINFFVAENNLSKNSKYFKKYLSFYKKDVYTLPFVAQKRFKKINNFNNRINKCLATGTVVNITKTGNPSDFKDFRKFYKTDVLQPIRNEILQKKDELKDIIDCSIGELYEKELKRTSSKNLLQKLFAKLYNALFATKRSYFKFDIVERYNSYKMFINGEEINDLPGIGFVEGMACGAAYIGQISDMYTDLGLVPGVHYIGYNGTLNDLKRKIRYYQTHSKKLEKIAEAGHAFVINNFTEKSVARKFFSDLKDLSEQYKKKKYKTDQLEFKCSFVK